LIAAIALDYMDLRDPYAAAHEPDVQRRLIGSRSDDGEEEVTLPDVLDTLRDEERRSTERRIGVDV
jgi:hypothetical protein